MEFLLLVVKILLVSQALIDDEGLELQVDAMFDTGFSYWLAIDNQDVITFNWARLERQTLRTARGDFDFDIYGGKVIVDGQEYDIPVHVGKGLSEVLLGRQWLQNKRLLVDMQSSTLTLG
jgi:predicted aspartyl protease